MTAVSDTIIQTIATKVPHETLYAFKDFVLQKKDIDISGIIQSYLRKTTSKRGRKPSGPSGPSGPSDLPETVLFPNVNIQHIELMPSNLDLSQYNFEINLNRNLKYVINFNLFHKVL